MDIVENTLREPLDAMLERPLFSFLATVSVDGDPRVSPLWYVWEDERVWIIADAEQTYTERVERHPRVALAIVDFDVHTGHVQHVGMRGRAAIVSLDDGRVDRLLRRYLGEENGEWDDGFVDLEPDRWRFIRFDPETVVARDQSFAPSLVG